MKKYLAFFAVIMLFCTLFAGCGSSEAGSIPTDSPYIGKWTAVKATFKDEETSMEDVVGEEFYFTLKADGTADVKDEGEDTTGTWAHTNEGFKLRIKDAKTDLKFRPEGDSIVMTLMGFNIYFERQ